MGPGPSPLFTVTSPADFNRLRELHTRLKSAERSSHNLHTASGRAGKWMLAIAVARDDPMIAGGGERSEVGGGDNRCRGAIAGGGEQSEVEAHWRAAITGHGRG